MIRSPVVEAIKHAAIVAEGAQPPIDKAAKFKTGAAGCVLGIVGGMGGGLVGVLGIGAVVYPPSLSETDTISVLLHVGALMVGLAASFLLSKWLARRMIARSVEAPAASFQQAMTKLNPTRDEVREALADTHGITWLECGVAGLMIGAARAS